MVVQKGFGSGFRGFDMLEAGFSKAAFRSGAWQFLLVFE